MNCDACGKPTQRTYHGRRVVRSGRDRKAAVQTTFCRDCAQTLLGLRLPPVKFPPLTMAELASLERRAREPNRGCQYFTAYEVLRLIATIVGGSLAEERHVGVLVLPEQLSLEDVIQ